MRSPFQTVPSVPGTQGVVLYLTENAQNSSNTSQAPGLWTRHVFIVGRHNSGYLPLICSKPLDPNPLSIIIALIWQVGSLMLGN